MLEEFILSNMGKPYWQSFFQEEKKTDNFQNDILDSAVVSALASHLCGPCWIPSGSMWEGNGCPSKVSGFLQVLWFPPPRRTSPKPLGQSGPNFTGMILGRFYLKVVQRFGIQAELWLPWQQKGLHWQNSLKIFLSETTSARSFKFSTCM